MRLRQITWLLKFRATRFFWRSFCEPGLQASASLRSTVEGGPWTAGVGHWCSLCCPCGAGPAPWPTPAASMSMCTVLHWLSFGSVRANEEDKDSSWIRYSAWFSLSFSVTSEVNVHLGRCWCAGSSAWLVQWSRLGRASSESLQGHDPVQNLLLLGQFWALSPSPSSSPAVLLPAQLFAAHFMQNLRIRTRQGQSSLLAEGVGGRGRGSRTGWLTAEGGKGVNPVFHLSGQRCVTSLSATGDADKERCWGISSAVCIAHAFTVACISSLGAFTSAAQPWACALLTIQKGEIPSPLASKPTA